MNEVLKVAAGVFSALIAKSAVDGLAISIGTAIQNRREAAEEEAETEKPRPKPKAKKKAKKAAKGKKR